MSIQDINKKLDEIDAKLEETVAGVDRGPVKDALRIVVPMMEDMTATMRLLVKEFTA